MSTVVQRGPVHSRLVGLLLLLTAAFTCAAAQENSKTRDRQSDPNSVSAAEAEVRIRAHMDLIDARIKQMSDLFYYSGAVKTLQESFVANGVHDSIQYADAWGSNGIGLTWSQSAKEFYQYHRDILKASLDIIRAQGFAKKADLAYLDDGMKRWQKYEDNFPALFNELVQAYTGRALVLYAKIDYMNAYYEKSSRLGKVEPFPESEMSALTDAMKSKTKEFDAMSKEHEATQDQATLRIAEHANMHLFSTIEEGVVRSTIK